MPDLSHVTVTQLIDAMTVQSPKGRVVQMHCRRSYGLSFCYDGQITYSHWGKEFVSTEIMLYFYPKRPAISYTAMKQAASP